MDNVYIIGASGFGKEVAWLIEENNELNILGFIDDNENVIGTKVNGYNVLGNIDYLISKVEDINVVIAIGNPNIRELIVNRLKAKSNIFYPNIISKDAIVSKYVDLGIGNIICTKSIVTTNIKFGNFNHVNLNCTIGHDVILEDFITIYPSVSVSGNVHINNYTELGTGSRIIQGKTLTSNVIVGAGAVVVKDLLEAGTYVGVPVKKVK